MAVTTVHAQLIRYTDSGTQVIVNLKSTGSDISIDRSGNSKLPSGATSVQGLANTLGKLAFADTIADASTSSSGLMTSTMVSKLNGIANGANAYSHPGYTARSSGLYKITVDGTGHVSAVSAVTKSDITSLGIPGSDTNTDTKVTQSTVTSSDYTNWRTVLWGASNSGTEGFSPSTVTDGCYTDKNLTYQPSSGTLRASIFKGTTTNVSGAAANTTTEAYRHVWFSDSGTETARCYNDAFKYDPKGNKLTVHITGNAASASSVAWGNVSGKPSSMPASDVYAWAKASSKPSYSWSEITGKPSTFTPSSHTHTFSQISDWGPRIYDATVARTANTVLAAPNGSNGVASFRRLVASDIPGLNYLPLSGGTLTGPVVLSNTYVASNGVNGGTDGYILMATVKIGGTYQNAPLEFTITRRSDRTPTKIAMTFYSGDTTDPGLYSFKTFGSTTDVYAYKSATSTWNIYVVKSEAWDIVDVIEYHKPPYDRGISVVFGATMVTTLPSGTIKATYGYNVGHALTADGLTNMGFLKVQKATPTEECIWCKID